MKLIEFYKRKDTTMKKNKKNTAGDEKCANCMKQNAKLHGLCPYCYNQFMLATMTINEIDDISKQGVTAVIDGDKIKR